VPAAVICTDPFVATVRAQARISGSPGFRFAVVAHPIGSLGPAELQARAAAALQQVLAILTGGRDD
jgi:hypothetical protein